ncbi:hypothetical protein D3C87_2058790 [compost metagenome]
MLHRIRVFEHDFNSFTGYRSEFGNGELHFFANSLDCYDLYIRVGSDFFLNAVRFQQGSIATAEIVRDRAFNACQ